MLACRSIPGYISRGHLLNPKFDEWYHSSNAMGREVSVSLRSPIDTHGQARGTLLFAAEHSAEVQHSDDNWILES